MENETPAMTLKQVIEALVFASPKPLHTKEITAAIKAAGRPEQTDDTLALDFAKAKDVEVHAMLMELQTDYLQSGRAFRLVEQVNGWSLVTDPGAAMWVRQLYPEAKPTRLTGPQLETLAIVAYRQPVTRADMEAVRGVSVDGVMQVLLDRSLVKIAGRAEVPGRPLLYTTTEYFLHHFGLKSTEDLPNAQELRRIALPVAPGAEAGKGESGASDASVGSVGSVGSVPPDAPPADSTPPSESQPPPGP